MKRLIAAVLATLSVASCGSPGENVGGGNQMTSGEVKYVHDTTHKVGLWYVIKGDDVSGPYVLPDAMYDAPQQ